METKKNAWNSELKLCTFIVLALQSVFVVVFRTLVKKNLQVNLKAEFSVVKIENTTTTSKSHLPLNACNQFPIKEAWTCAHFTRKRWMSVSLMQQ